MIASVAARVSPESAKQLLVWTKPQVERDPGGLGWLADLAATYKVLDPVPLLEEATRLSTATADDWLRLAITRSPADLNAARDKIAPAAFVAAAAILRETPSGKDFQPRLRSAVEKRLFVQAQLALALSRGKPDEAARALESYLADHELSKADAAWCRRNLAMLYAVGGTTADRKRAMELVKEVTETGASAEELRATASVLTTLGAYLEARQPGHDSNSRRGIA